MFAVDFCGCVSFDRKFYPSSWLAEVTLKHWYDPKVVAQLTYSRVPLLCFVPANVLRRPRSSPYCTRRS